MHDVRADMTTGPIVIGGTKCPSITSTCSTLAPPRSQAAVTVAIWVKSAASSEGAKVMFMVCVVMLKVVLGAAVSSTTGSDRVAS